MKKLMGAVCIALALFQTDRIKSQSLNDKIENYGLNLNVDFKNDFLKNMSGGINTKSAYIGLFNPALTIDLDKMLNWNGADMIISAIGNIGNNFCNEVGAEQGIDNIEAFDTWKIYEFWIEQELFDKTLSLKAGLYNLNSEFDARFASSIFINPSQGIGPEYSLTGKNGPSIFPTTSLSLRIKYQSNSSSKEMDMHYYLQTAVLDGIPGDPNNPVGTHIILNRNDGFLLAAETGFVNGEDNFSNGYEKFSLGAWFYTTKFERLLDTDISGNPLYQKGNYGIYFSAESDLGGYCSKAKDSDEGPVAFVRLGYADKNINRVDAYLGSGINFTGLIHGRDKDALGAAIAVTHNSSKYITQMQRKNIEVCEYESIIELTYLFNFSLWLKIQPDIQYVFDPAYCKSSDYAFVSVVRLELTF